jgi:hypothetical protein
MNDLERELHDGLRSAAAYVLEADERLPEFRRRLARHRRRRQAGVGLVAAALVLAGATAIVVRDSHREAAPAAPVTTATTATSSVADMDVGPPLEPSSVWLPDEGVAVDSPVGVVLVGLDGHVFGHLAGFDVATVEESSGPLLLRTERQWFLLDNHRIREVEQDDIFVVMPLAYGAELATGTGAPSRRIVRRDGHDVFDLGNAIDAYGWISYDRDIATREDDITTRALDLRTGRTSSVPRGCWIADRHGRRRYLSCEDGLRAGEEDDPSPPMLQGAVDAEGWWKRVMASPDNTRLLLGWDTRDCSHHRALLRTAADGDAPLEQPFGEVSAEAYGWSADGRAVVSVGMGWESDCRAETAEAGVYLVGIDGSRLRIYAGHGGRVAMWAPALK